jgi:hypothetical protein
MDYSFTNSSVLKLLVSEDLRLFGRVGYGADIGHELLEVGVREVGFDGLHR